jgi:hypothetical protein
MPKRAKIRILQVCKTTRYIPGEPALPSDWAVTVTATGSGRFQVECMRTLRRYWVDADALEPV